MLTFVARVLGIAVGLALLLRWAAAKVVWLVAAALLLVPKWPPRTAWALRATALVIVAVLIGGGLAFSIPAALWPSVPRFAPDWGLTGWLGRLLLYALLVASVPFAFLCFVMPALTLRSAVKRRASLLDREGVTGTQTRVAPGALPRPDGATGRNIVIFCDGTGNRPDDTEAGEPATTNVWKLYRAMVNDERQTTWYDPGVGTGTSSAATEAQRTGRLFRTLGVDWGSWASAFGGKLARAFEGATGAGILENVEQAYAEIVRQYRPGDRIHLIGFSRGAYTCRLVAGVIERAGLLRPEYYRYAADLVYLYRTRPGDLGSLPTPRHMIHDPDVVRIEFMGLFDTVASLGVPLWGWWFRLGPFLSQEALTAAPLGVCREIHHAMAMDERRSQFFPTPFTASTIQGVELRQVWFRGAHADIGGGYADTSLSDITYKWMRAAIGDRLIFRDDPSFHPVLRDDPNGRLHDELSRRPSWRLFGSWPRWHPVPGGAVGPYPAIIAGEVEARRAVTEEQLGRPDFLRVTKPVAFDVQPHREWDRTGLVLGQGLYRLRYVGGEWRDAECTPCGPAGQALGLSDWLRALFAFQRRLPSHPYMRLCLTVAHPRRWDLAEYGFWRLLRYLFWEDPDVLLDQVAPVGRDLETPGQSVILHVADDVDGLLYVFANDLWLTATNNAGTVRLTIERVEAGTPGEPVWTLSNGRWIRPPARPVSSGA